MVLVVADVLRNLDAVILEADYLDAIVFDLRGEAFREKLVFRPIAVPAVDHVSGA